MRIAMPPAIRRVPLDEPQRAIQEFAGILAELRDAPRGAAADLEAIATEAVESAIEQGAYLMAVVTPPDAAPALLTGVVLEFPLRSESAAGVWTDEQRRERGTSNRAAQEGRHRIEAANRASEERASAIITELLRDSLEDVGGPDVRETITVDTGLGPAVVVQRVPGIEQARARLPLTLQLQAFVPEPGTGRMLLLTLACPASTGWAAHQALFGELVASASRGPVAVDESFDQQTYRL